MAAPQASRSPARWASATTGAHPRGAGAPRRAAPDLRRQAAGAAAGARGALRRAGRRRDAWTSCPRPRDVREGDWRVAPPAPGLVDRRVEITGPTDRKMTINALNSGAKVLAGRLRGRQHPAVGQRRRGPAQPARRASTARSTSPRPRARRTRSRRRTLATIVVRPRGWHLPEKHITVDGEPISGSLVDFAPLLLPLRPAAARRAARGPYFYLPKMESHLEARLWNDVFLLGAGPPGHPARHHPGHRA